MHHLVTSTVEKKVFTRNLTSASSTGINLLFFSTIKDHPPLKGDHCRPTGLSL